MQVTVNYTDDSSLTVEEIVRAATLNYGKLAQVKIEPDSTNPHDLIYFGIQQIITHQQLSLLYDDKTSYQKNIQSLRNDIMYKLDEIVSQVIMDNEGKVT